MLPPLVFAMSHTGWKRILQAQMVNQVFAGGIGFHREEGNEEIDFRRGAVYL